ncbi:MAG: hypothetical protein ABDH63_05500 [Candidatus Caldarchaeales archaeon]
MRELKAYLVKSGVGVLAGAASAYLSVLAHWALAVLMAAGVYLLVTYVTLGPVRRDNPHLTGRRAWTLAVGAYSTVWLTCWLLFYNLLV